MVTRQPQSLLDILPDSAHELLTIAEPALNANRQRQLAFLAKCATCTAPGIPSLLGVLREARHRMRESMDDVARELLWVAMAHLSHQVLIAEAGDAVNLLGTLSIRDRLPELARWNTLQSRAPVFTYSVRQFRMAMRSLQRHVCRNWWHAEAREFLRELEKHCLSSLIPECAQYEDEAPDEDAMYNDADWCNRTERGGDAGGGGVTFHCNRRMLLMTESLFTALEGGLCTRECWQCQVVLPVLPPALLSDLLHKTWRWVIRRRATLDLLDHTVNEMFGAFFLYPGEREIVRIRDPTAPPPSAQHVVSRVRPRELTQATNYALERSAEEHYRWRLDTLAAYLEGDKDAPDSPSRGVCMDAAYDWRQSHSTLPPRDMISDTEDAAYALTFVAALRVQHMDEGRPARTNLSHGMKLRGSWKPGDQWHEEDFPYMVQCNDWRFHVAVDAQTLLVCPNVETAYFVWHTLRQQQHTKRCTSISTARASRHKRRLLLQCMK